MERCSSTYCNFAEQDLNTLFSRQDTCAIVHGNLGTSVTEVNAPQWFDVLCETNDPAYQIQCIYQYSANLTYNIFSLDEKKWEEFGSTRF